MVHYIIRSQKYKIPSEFEIKNTKIMYFFQTCIFIISIFIKKLKNITFFTFLKYET